MKDSQERVDVLVSIDSSNGRYIIEPQVFEKDSEEVIVAKERLAAIAYKAMKEGYVVYRKIGNQLVEANLEFDYPYVYELVLRMDSEKENTHSMGK